MDCIVFFQKQNVLMDCPQWMSCFELTLVRVHLGKSFCIEICSCSFEKGVILIDVFEQIVLREESCFEIETSFSLRVCDFYVFFLRWMHILYVSFVQAVFKNSSMVSMISWFLFALYDFKDLSFHGCYNFSLCLSGVVTITHGIIVALMDKSSFFFALYGFNPFFLLWMQSFLPLLKRCLKTCLWFQRCLRLSVRSMVSMTSSLY